MISNTTREMKALAGIDAIVQNLFISAALLDQSGLILEVSQGWRDFATEGKLKLKNYGVGQNYLRYVLFPENDSLATLRGLKSVLGKTIDVFSTLYHCDTPTARRWFMLAAFALDNRSAAAAAILHIDITPFLTKTAGISAAMEGVGPGAVDPAMDKLVGIVRRTIAESIRVTGGNTFSSGSAKEHRLISTLSPRQLSLLRELARGATNSQIARVHKITVNSAKSQTAALFKKLGVANRTQAALLAARNGLAGRSTESA